MTNSIAIHGYTKINSISTGGLSQLLQTIPETPVEEPTTRKKGKGIRYLTKKKIRTRFYFKIQLEIIQKSIQKIILPIRIKSKKPVLQRFKIKLSILKQATFTHKIGGPITKIHRKTVKLPNAISKPHSITLGLNHIILKPTKQTINLNLKQWILIDPQELAILSMSD